MNDKEWMDTSLVDFMIDDSSNPATVRNLLSSVC